MVVRGEAVCTHGIFWQIHKYWGVQYYGKYGPGGLVPRVGEWTVTGWGMYPTMVRDAETALRLIEPLYREYRLIESVDGFDK